MRLRRIYIALLAFMVLLAPCSPGISAALAEGNPPTETTSDFIDKWILNGNSIGGAAGATIGQWLGTIMAPGPVGWIVGSLVGGMIGGIIGTLIDNQIHNAYNYASFSRPPLEDGGFWLEGVGPWEQAMYQVDQWAISGGGLASLVAHFGVNLLGAAIPGPAGKFLSSYAGIFLFDAIFGTLGDNVDALVDGGDLGRELDEHFGTAVDDGPDAAAAPRGAFVEGEDPVERDEARRQAYKRYTDLARQGKGSSPEGQAAYLEYVRLGN